MKKTAIVAIVAGATSLALSVPAQAATLPKLTNDYSSDTYVLGYPYSNCKGTRRVVYPNHSYASAASFKSPESGYGKWQNGNIIYFHAGYCINIYSGTSIRTFN